jgi:uncharacterized protein (DUF2236 family)
MATMHGSDGPSFDHWDIEVDIDDLPEDLAALAAEVETPAEGFFGQGSMTWQINRENAMYLAGVTAALLQLGHPKVAAGVADHSDFSEDPTGRFIRTFEIVDSIVFADLETALEAALVVRRIHDWVTGELQEDLGPYEAGETYDATTEENLLWVHATLLEQSIVAYETFLGELTDDEKAEYYQEAKVFGELFGIPRERYPETLDDFWAYYERELEETVAVGTRGMEQRDLLLEASVIPGVSRLRALRPIQAFFGAATMPEPARETFELPWNGRRQRIYDGVVGVVRRLLPYVPYRLRYNRNYRRNIRRLRDSHRAELRPDHPKASR